MSQQAPNKNSLLARADVRMFQCVVRDSKLRQRHIMVYQCGTDVAYAASRFGLMDPDRARKAPKWLRDQILNPPDYTQIFNYRGERINAQLAPAEPTAPVVQQPEGGEDLELSEDEVLQG